MLARPDFKTTGFEHCSGYFDEAVIKQAEHDIFCLYAMQARKIGYSDHSATLAGILDGMEGNDKRALYEVQKYLSASQRVRSLFSAQLMRTCAARIGCTSENVLLEGPALFVSRPYSPRLLYKWHSEAHYYPKRRRFLNLWFPIFTDRTEENGAMHIKPGSHREQWDFAEYDSGPNTFVQYEIPEDWVKGYDTHICESKRGDLIMFDRNLVHKSSENRSKDYAFAMVARAWCPIDDLTLSGNMAATPYGGDYGRAGLVAER